MVSRLRVGTVVDNLQVPSLVVVAVPSLHVAVVVPLLIPELSVVPATSIQVSGQYYLGQGSPNAFLSCLQDIKKPP